MSIIRMTYITKPVCLSLLLGMDITKERKKDKQKEKLKGKLKQLVQWPVSLANNVVRIDFREQGEQVQA